LNFFDNFWHVALISYFNGAQYSAPYHPADEMLLNIHLTVGVSYQGFNLLRQREYILFFRFLFVQCPEQQLNENVKYCFSSNHNLEFVHWSRPLNFRGTKAAMSEYQSEAWIRHQGPRKKFKKEFTSNVSTESILNDWNLPPPKWTSNFWLIYNEDLKLLSLGKH